MILSQVTMDLEELEMELIDGGLENLEVDEESITVYCDYTEFSNMQKRLETLEIEIQKFRITENPKQHKNYLYRTSGLSFKIIR